MLGGMIYTCKKLKKFPSFPAVKNAAMFRSFTHLMRELYLSLFPPEKLLTPILGVILSCRVGDQTLPNDSISVFTLIGGQALCCSTPEVSVQ